MWSVLGLISPTEKGFLSAELVPGFMEAMTGSAGLGKVALVRAGGAEVRPEIFGLAGRSGAAPGFCIAAGTGPEGIKSVGTETGPEILTSTGNMMLRLSGAE